MRRFLTSLAASLALSGVAQANPIVVWLSSEVPETRDQRRAESDTGEATHLAHIDLAWPPAAATGDDEAAYDALRGAVVDGEARWQDWDVELDIAQDLGDALEDITVVRNDRDLRDLVDALLLQGAAASRAFPPGEFGTLPEAESYRLDAPGGPINAAWYTAMALAPERAFARADIADGGPFDDFARVQRRVAEFPGGTLDLSRVPEVAQVFVDGTFVGTGVQAVDLAPGVHYFHTVRGGRIAGRSTVQVEAGRSVEAPMVVDDAELAAARQAFLDGNLSDLPADVKTALDSIQRTYRQGVFVAAVDDDGRVEVRPYRGAELVGRKLVTLMVTGGIGFTHIQSAIFDDANGEKVGAPGAVGGVGLELGIANFALLGGFDAAFTPTQTITYGNSDQTENNSTSILPQPWGGVGVYVLRPNKPRPTLLLAGTYTFLGPAHTGLGGRLIFGVPLDEQGTWFRISAGGTHSGDVIGGWDGVFTEPVPMDALFARLGFAARF